MNLLETRKKVNKKINDLNTAQQIHENENSALDKAVMDYEYLGTAQLITQQVSQTIQQKAHHQIAGVVSRCLQTVFQDNYGFKINFERKRGRTEANLILLKDGYEIEDALNSDSGGVVDVAAFALRLSCLVLAKPSLRRILILDEPFKFVSEEYRDNIKSLLKGLAKDFKMQFIMVTHITELQIGKVLKL